MENKANSLSTVQFSSARRTVLPQNHKKAELMTFDADHEGVKIFFHITDFEYVSFKIINSATN